MHSSQDFSQFRILIVDDVPLNRVLVEKMLGNFNFNVHQCENGLECMKELSYQKPDLDVLHILMLPMIGLKVNVAEREDPP